MDRVEASEALDTGSTPVGSTELLCHSGLDPESIMLINNL